MAWSPQRIKGVHDVHVHYPRGNGSEPEFCQPCPACPYCKCPVHRDDPHAVVPTQVTANKFKED